MKKILLICLMLLTLNINLLALEPNPYITDSGILITPFLETGVMVDDNIFNQPAGELDTSIFTVSPSVNLLFDDGIKRFEVDLGLESVYVDGHSEDNYLDSNLNFSGHIEQGTRVRWGMSADVRQVTEARGTGLTQGSNAGRFAEPLTFDAQSAAVRYEYGALSTAMRLAVDLEYNNRSYKNYRESTNHLDRDRFLIGTTFYYSTNSKTNMFFEVNQENIDYKRIHPSGFSRDSDDTHILLGIEWKASGLMTGIFSLGQQQKSFADPDRKDFNGLSWDVGIEWRPLTYSSIFLNSSKDAKDPYTDGDYISETTVEIIWQHQWSDRFDTRTAFLVSEEEFSGQNINRTDDYQMFSLNLDYNLLRWLDITLFVRIIDNESTRNDIVFDKTIGGISFRISI